MENEKTNSDGEFSLSAVPLGVYIITAAQSGFGAAQQTITLAANTSPVLHFELQVAAVHESVTVNTSTSAADVDSITPTTLISREDIARTPGADRTNSMAMITDYVPGAYMTHDMLHMRGGHRAELDDRRREHSQHQYREQHRARRSTPRILTIWRPTAGAIEPAWETALMAFLTSFRAAALSAIARASW